MINRNSTGDYKKKVCQYALMDGLVMETLASSLDRDDILYQLQELNK